MSKINLFCFPYAGGSAVMIYSKWKQYLDKSIDLYPVELAGRGKRIYDPLYQSIDEAVDDVYNLINSKLDELPYSLFGHSMGSIIAFELSQKIRQNNRPEPIHLFFSGRGAPHIPEPESSKVYHTMPEDEFIKEVIELGGISKEFFEHKELLDLLLPMMKNDFKISEIHIYNKEWKPFDFNISIFIGKKEEVSAEQMFGWKDRTKKICNIRYFEGGHFFINDETEDIVNFINNTLAMEYSNKKKYIGGGWQSIHRR